MVGALPVGTVWYIFLRAQVTSSHAVTSHLMVMLVIVKDVTSYGYVSDCKREASLCVRDGFSIT